MLSRSGWLKHEHVVHQQRLSLWLEVVMFPCRISWLVSEYKCTLEMHDNAIHLQPKLISFHIPQTTSQHFCPEVKRSTTDTHPHVDYRSNHVQVSTHCFKKSALVSWSHQSRQNSSPNGCIEYKDTQESTTVIFRSETARKSFSFVHSITKETPIPGKASVRPKETKCTEAK